MVIAGALAAFIAVCVGMRAIRLHHERPALSIGDDWQHPSLARRVRRVSEQAIAGCGE